MSKDDSEFYRTFKGGMTVLGLPAPETLFGSLTVTTATIGAMANGIRIVGSKATLSEILLTVPLAAGGAVAAAGIAEVVAAVAAMSASYYLGACIGCLLAAGFDVYGMALFVRIGRWLFDLQRTMGRTLDQMLMEWKHPTMGNAPMRKAIPLARMVSGRQGGRR